MELRPLLKNRFESVAFSSDDSFLVRFRFPFGTNVSREEHLFQSGCKAEASDFINYALFYENLFHRSCMHLFLQQDMLMIALPWLYYNQRRRFRWMIL